MDLIGPVTHLVVHHTDSPDTTTRADIDAWHVAMGGIGYHRLVRRDEMTDAVVVEAGRGEAHKGAHVKRGNTGRLGLALAGNYQYRPPPADMLAVAAVELGVWLWRYRLTPGAIITHSEALPGHTVCPGAGLEGVMPLLRSRAASVSMALANGLADLRAASWRP